MFFVSSGEIHRYAGLTLRSAARFAVAGNIRGNVNEVRSDGNEVLA